MRRGHYPTPRWIRERETALRQAAEARRRQERREAMERADEDFSRLSPREEALERLEALAATTPCPMCGDLEKSAAMLTSRALVSRCRSCGWTWETEL